LKETQVEPVVDNEHNPKTKVQPMIMCDTSHAFGKVKASEIEDKDFVAWKAWKKDNRGSRVVGRHVFQNITNCSIVIGSFCGDD
jgi:hypothetical protein